MGRHGYWVLDGDGHVTYASDYPHWDAMTPWTVKILAGRADLSEEAKRKVLGDNAARFYGLAPP
jgi:predicted TIM-barrel fold metal-dependent hydrolase